MTTVPPSLEHPERPEGAGPPAAPPEPSVPVWLPFAVLAGVFVLIGLLSVAAFALLQSADPGVKASDPPDLFTIVLTVVQDGVFIFAAWVAVRTARNGATPAVFGLRRVSATAALKWAALLYGLFWLISAAVIAIFGQPPEQDIVEELKAQDSTVILAAYAALTCMLAPIAEEFFFRGFMFTTFRRRMGAVWAGLLTGAIFGLVHAPGSPLLGVLVLAAFGVLLCGLYERTGSIIPCMALHALHNSISFGATKSLPPAAFAGLIALSVGVVVAIAGTVAGPARAGARPAAAAA